MCAAVCLFGAVCRASAQGAEVSRRRGGRRPQTLRADVIGRRTVPTWPTKAHEAHLPPGRRPRCHVKLQCPGSGPARVVTLRAGTTRGESARGRAPAVEPDSAAFASLAADHGVDVASIRLGCGPEGYRGIFACREFQTGDVVLGVPHRLLLAASHVERTDAARGGSVPGDVTSRHNDLATVLLASRLASEGHTDEIASLKKWLWDSSRATLPEGRSSTLPEVWERYSAEFVPPAEAQTSLVFFAPEELPELQHQDLQKMVLRLYGEDKLPTFGQERGSVWAKWAIGSVHSRVFSTSAGNYVLMVPFADMLNHREDPNCKFRSNLTAPLCQRASHGLSVGAAFEVIADTDISAGEELTISYGATKENWEMMLSYGFVPVGGNGADRVKLPEEGLPPLSQSGIFRCAIQARYGGVSAPRVSAASQTLAQTQSQLSGDEELSRCRLAREKLEQALGAFPTSTEEDMELLNSVQSSGLTGAPLRLAAAVTYRLQRKEVLKTALGLLDILEDNLRGASS